MTNILVPTDFTAASLRTAESALKNGNLSRCNLVLFHAFALPADSFDLLGPKSRHPMFEVLDDRFRLACKQLKDEYGQQVNKVVIRCMMGDTLAVFRNFTEANDIDLICCPDGYQFQPVHPRSLNPLAFFQQCGIPMMKVTGRRIEPQFDNNGYYPALQMSAQ